MKRRGLAMGPLMFLLFFCFSLILLFAARGLIRKQQSELLEKRAKAVALAESGLATALACFSRDHAYVGPCSETMAYPEDGAAGFNCSVMNNWGKDAPVMLEGRVVCPAGCLFLSSVGTYRGYSATVETLLSVPAFNSAIASAGSLSSSGGLLLGGLPAGALDLTKLVPSQLQAGGNLTLQGSVNIEGKALAALDAESGPQVNATLGVLPRSQVDALPDIDLAALDFTGQPGLQTLPTNRFEDFQKLSGLSTWSGSQLTFDKGLALNGGVVRVHGDLVINGPLTGTGALIVDGTVTVNGTAAFNADNMCAIVAGGNVSLAGGDRGSSYYQGLVYSHGAVNVTDLTLVGTLVSTKADAVTSISRANVVYDARAVNITVEPSFSGYPEGGFEVLSGTGGPSNYLRLKSLPGQPAGSVPTPAALAQAGFSSLSEVNFELVDEAGESASGSIAGPFNANNRRIAFMSESVSAAANNNNPTFPRGQLNLELNRFLQISDKLRILWRR